MPEKYIERDALIARLRVSPLFLGREDIRDGAIELVEIQPAADVVECGPGRWIDKTNWYECSECHTAGSPLWKCCPVCTAIMDATNTDVGRKRAREENKNA